MKKAKASGKSLTWEVFDLVNSIRENGMLPAYYNYIKSKKAKNTPLIYRGVFDIFLKRLNEVDLTEEIDNDLEEKIREEISSEDKNTAKRQLKSKIIEFVTWHYRQNNKTEYELDTLLWEAKALSTQKFSRVFYEDKMRQADTKIKEFVLNNPYSDASVFARYYEQYFQVFIKDPDEELAQSSYYRLLSLLNRVYRLQGKEILLDFQPSEQTPYLVYDVVGKYCFEETDINSKIESIDNQINDMRSKDISHHDIKISYLEIEKIILSFKAGITYSNHYLDNTNLTKKTFGLFARLMLNGSEGKLFFKEGDMGSIAERLELNRIFEACYFSDIETLLKLTKEALKYTNDSKIKTKLFLIECICETNLKRFEDARHTLDTIKRKHKELEDFDRNILKYLETPYSRDLLSNLKKENERFDNPFANAILELLGK